MAKFVVGKPEEVTRYVSARQQRAKPKAKMQPPLTPMIDVTFQLLIFFLVATEFRQPEGNIPGTLPQAPIAADQPAVDFLDPLKITIRPGSGSVEVIYELEGAGFQINDPERLYEQLRSYRKAHGDSKEIPVIIHPLYTVPWNLVVDAFNQAIRAGYESITFAHGGT